MQSIDGEYQTNGVGIGGCFFFKDSWQSDKTKEEQQFL